MSDKKRITSWFTKNIILPNNEIIDKPGYIVYRFGSKKRNCYLREVFLPESVLAGIETAFAKNYGQEGKKAVYTAGKMWGYRFAATSGLPTMGALPESEFAGFMETLVRLLETIYAAKMSHTLDLKRKAFELTSENLVIYRKSGLGHFLTGTLNGTWEYLTGVQTEGLLTPGGPGESVIRCAPLAEHGSASGLFEAKLPQGLGLEPDYFTFNKVNKTKYAKNSFRDLLEAGAVKYEGGFFDYGKERLVLDEASSVYFLEMVLGKLDGGSQLLFETVHKHCTDCIPGKGRPEKFLTDFVPALGWGDVHFDRQGSRVVCLGYPWTKYHKETSFPMIRGMASGILSGGGGPMLGRAKAEISSGALNLVLEPE